MRLYYLLFAAVCIFSTACNHKYYAPNKLNTPFLPTVKDSEVSVGMYTADEFSGVNLQGTFRPIENLAVGAHLFTGSSNQKVTTFEGAPNKGKGYLGEVCIGPYWQVRENMAVSLLLGGGFGQTNHEYGFDKNAKLNFQRQFIQPTFKFRRSHFSLGTGLRLCRLDYTGGSVNVAISPDELAVIQAIDAKSPFYLPELGLNLGFVGKHFTLEYSVTNLLFQKNYEYRFADRIIGLDLVFNPVSLWKAISGKKRR